MRISLLTVTGGYHHIKSLPRAGEVHFEVPCSVTPGDHTFKETAHGVADKVWLVLIYESVTREFDEDPLGAAFDGNVGVLPAMQTSDIGSIVCCQDAVLKTRNRHPVNPPMPIKNQWSRDNYWEAGC